MACVLPEEECPCCLEPIESTNLMVVPCGHKFHFRCGIKWFKNHKTCPNCRSDAGHEVVVTNKLMLSEETMPEFERLASRYNILLGNKIYKMATEYSDRSVQSHVELVDDLVMHRWKSLVYLKNYNLAQDDPEEIWKTMSQKDKKCCYLKALKHIMTFQNKETMKTILEMMSSHMLH